MIDFLLSLDHDELVLFAIPVIVGIVLFALSRISAFLAHKRSSRSAKMVHSDFLQHWRDRKYGEAATTFFLGQLPKPDTIIGKMLI